MFMSMVKGLGAGLTGIEQLRALMKAGKRPGIGDALDFTLVEVSEGSAVFTGTPGQHAYNPIGMVHGGYAATLLDSACGCAIHTQLGATQMYTTLELKVAYHKAITDRTGPLRAEGKVVSIGRRVGFAEARLVDQTGKLHASATSTLLIIEEKT
jgi:uncharacterized protein (TIGR00369 family)